MSVVAPSGQPSWVQGNARRLPGTHAVTRPTSKPEGVKGWLPRASGGCHVLRPLCHFAATGFAIERACVVLREASKRGFTVVATTTAAGFD
jgi:hypothetical protein